MSTPDPFAKFRVPGGQPQQQTAAPTVIPAQAHEGEQVDPFARFRVREDFAVAPVSENDLGEEFHAGLLGGIDTAQGSLYGLAAMIGRETGITALETAGRDRAIKNFEDAANSGRQSGGFSDIEDAGGFFKWAAASLGEAIPSLSMAMTGGGLGGVVAKKTVENQLKKTLATRVAKQLRRKGATVEEAAASTRRIMAGKQGQQLLRDAVFRGKTSDELLRSAFTKGGMVGGSAVSAGPQIGQTDLELQAAGIDSGFTSLIAGVAGGALEALPALKLIDRLFPGIDTQLSKSFVKDFAVATGMQASLEGGTEAAQEAIQLAAMAFHDPSFDMFSPEARTRVLDAFAAGALVGGVTGGIGEGAGQAGLAVRKGAGKVTIPPMPEWKFRADEEAASTGLPEGFVPADQPLWKDIRDRVFSTVGPQIESAVNSARGKVSGVFDSINKDTPGLAGAARRAAAAVKQRHDEFVKAHEAEINRVKAHLDQQAKRVYEAARSIPDPAKRKEFVDGELAAIKTSLAAFVDKLRRMAAKRDQDTEAEVDNMDFDDDVDVDNVGSTIDEKGNVIDLDADVPFTRPRQEPEDTRIEAARKRHASLVTARDALRKRIAETTDEDILRTLRQKERLASEQVDVLEQSGILDQGKKKGGNNVVPFNPEVDNMDVDDDMFNVDDEGEIVDEQEGGILVEDTFEEEETLVGPSGRKFTRKRGAPVEAQSIEGVASGPEAGELDPGPTAVFGKFQKRPTVDVAGRETVKGYDDREQAQKGIASLLEDLPGAKETDFETVEQDDGTVVIHIRNPELAEDLSFNESFRKARRIADESKKEGAFKIEEGAWKGGLRGTKSPRLNLTTMAWEGMSLLPSRDGRSLRDGFAAFVSKMLDRGMIEGETAQEMLDAFDENNPEAANPEFAEAFAPVSRYPQKNVAVAIMRGIAERIENQFNIEFAWPRKMIDVAQNSDGTWSFRVMNKGMFNQLLKKDPERARAIAKAIRTERRAEKLASEERGLNIDARDTGTIADPRGNSAQDARIRTTRRQKAVDQTKKGQAETTITPVDEQSRTGDLEVKRVDGRARLVEAPATNQKRLEDTDPQYDDRITNPESLPGEFETDRQAELDVERAAEHARTTSPKAKQPQTEKDNELLRTTYARKSKVKVMMSQRNVTAKKVRQAVRDITTFVRDTLGLENDVIVMDDAGLRYMIEKGLVSDAVFKETLDNPKVNARNIRIGNQSYVYISDKVAKDPALTVLALGHELGHHLYQVAWDNLTLSGQETLKSAYRATLSGPAESQEAFDHGFNEWMADQLAAWMVNRRVGRNTVEKFFAAVGRKIKRLYDFIAGKDRFKLNETYADFADAVADRARAAESPGANPLRDENMRFWFKNEGVTMYKWFGNLPSQDNMQIPYADRQVTENVSNAMKRFEQNYPGIAARAMTLRNWVTSAYSMVLAPSTSVMKSLGKRVPVALEIAHIFGRQNHGDMKTASNYHQRVNLMKGQFSTQYDNVRNEVRAEIKKQRPGAKKAEVETLVNNKMREIAVSLRSKEGKHTAEFTPTEAKLRKLFDEMHAYAVEAGLPVRNIRNYFPKQFSREKLIAHKDRIIKHLTDDVGMNMSDARGFYNSLVSPEANDGRATRDAIETPSFKNMNSRTMKDKFFNEFLDDNLDGIVSNYINAVVKRTEFNRVLGEPGVQGMDIKEAIKEGLWDPKGQYHKYLKRAQKEGATDDDIKIIEKYIDANLGQLGRDDISPGVRKWMAGVMAYQNMRVLLFTVLASFPDMVGPAIRAGSMREAFTSVKNGMREIATDDNALAEMARAYGIISDTANQHIMTEYVDNHYMPPKLRKWNDSFFKWTGLNWYTDFTRKAALAVGVDYIQNQAAIFTNPPSEKAKFKAQNALEELGLTPEHVRQWVADGKPTYHSLAIGGRTYEKKIAEALVQFVDESIMRPNAAQRPILASHPAAMLVFHLKGYLYAVHEVVLKRMKYNVDEADTPAQIAAALAPALAMMALTAVGLELREIIQYAGSDRQPPTDSMDGWEYTWELFSRSGLTGMSQLAFDFEGADERGMAEIAGIGGPTLAQIGDFLSKPATQTVPKAIPVIGQLPAAREAVRTVL